MIGAKVRAPDVRALQRDRLHDLLARLWDHRLGLIVAPAGSGKTTLLAQFAASVDVPVSWYRAEASDATEEAFLAHLGQSCEARFAGLDTQWASVEEMVAAIEAWEGRGGLIVIDEVDALWGTEAEAAVERLVDYLPRQWAILASARRLPGLNLSRLRVNGHLLEIGPEELRFRFWEVERLFRDFYGEPLPPDQLAELTRRTEGWAAGLQLFHLATRGHPARERRRLLTELGRRSRLMREYLATNVIDQLPPDLRAFLVETSVLGRLTAPLCDAVTGRADSDVVLAELEQARLFTHRTGIDAFRYHEVLRSHLEASLIDSVGDNGARQRFRAAGQLLEDDGALPDAVRAYCRAEDWDAVTRLLGGRGEEAMAATGDWIDLLPSALLDQDPWLQLGSARRYVSTGRWAAAVDAYQRAETLFGHGQSAELCRRERTALANWLEPVSGPVTDWTSALRDATRRDPAAAVDGYAGATDGAERLACAIGLLLAGEARRANDLAVNLIDAGLSPVLTLAAELVGALGAMLCGAPVVIELDRIGEEADAAGVPWLAGLARGLIRGPVPGSPTGDQKDDPWSPALAPLLATMRTLLAGGRPTDGLDQVADEFRRLGAPVLESWTRSAAALAAARSREPGAAAAARDAELRARSAAVPGALALALVALAVAEPEHEAAHMSAARAIGDATGIDVWRLVGPRRPGQAMSGRARVIGRDRERSELRAYVDGLLAHRGRTVLLSGPSGIGKTRLAEDIVEYASAQGAAVLWGQAAAGAGPYSVWGQIVRAHLMGRDLVDDPVRTDDLAALSRLVPELPELLPNAPMDLAGEVSQQEVFDATAAFIGSVAARQPLLVVVDDLHQADATSVRLFEFLSRMLVAQPALIVGAHQDTIGAALSSLTSASRIRLGGLPDDAIEALVHDVTGEEPGPALISALVELTGGNPFFILELARTVAADRPGRLKDVRRSDLRLPPSLRDLALARLGELSETTSELLSLAAVVGRSFGLAVLEAAAKQTPESVLAAMGEARAAGLIEDDGPAPGTFRFTHGILQEALYETQAPVERADRHNRIGEAIEAISAPMLDPRVPELAHHLLLGASTGDRARAAAYGRRAAAQALDHAAYEDAVSWATTALDALSGLRGHNELRRRLLDLSAAAEAALGDEERAARFRAAAASLPHDGHDASEEPNSSAPVALPEAPNDGPVFANGGQRRLAARCFGAFELWIDGTRVDIAQMKPRVRSLLRLLCLRAGAVHREQLIDALWAGTDVRTATRSLQTAVSALRQQLEPGVARGDASVVVREGDTYRLALPDGTVTDVAAFEDLSREVLEGGANGRTAGLAVEALDLYRGDLLEEEGPAEWVVAERERLRMRAAEVAELGASAALEAGATELAQRLAEAGLGADRYRDGLWRVLQDVHAARGDSAAGARTEQQYRQMLTDLGITPAPEG